MRDDITDNLVHLTKGIGEDKSKHREEACINFISILKKKTLIGGIGFIKGEYECVCFSEAPIDKLSDVIAHGIDPKFKYQPYGVQVTKKWLYGKGGRPVIYGHGDEFFSLPEEFKYRHVRYELGAYDIDHSWEREWRIKTKALKISPESSKLIVPDNVAKEIIEKNVSDEWEFTVLSDFGIYIDPLKC